MKLNGPYNQLWHALYVVVFGVAGALVANMSLALVFYAFGRPVSDAWLGGNTTVAIAALIVWMVVVAAAAAVLGTIGSRVFKKDARASESA